jgi:integrase
MADSKAPAVVRKPRPDFPLFPHASGRWAKKVLGKLRYFGKTADDPKGKRALDLWNEQKDELLAGRVPRTKTDRLTVGELCSLFVTAKDDLLDAGEITQRTRDGYKSTCDRLVLKFGKTRPVTDLANGDFQELRKSIAKKWGPVALGNEIQRIRMVFKFGLDCGLIPQMKYGPQFVRPSKKVLRLARAEKGQKMLEADDVKRLIHGADVHLKAMALLAINCGFGNNDVGTLPLAAVDLDGGWVNYHRPKTGIPRRCSLWPETVAAVRASLADRPKPKSPAAEALVFVTRCGMPWAKDNTQNPVCGEFGKLLKAMKLHRPGLGFYTLRHVFRTVADESRDQPAINSIMGHSDPSMAAVYRERIGDDRLRAVADHVRAWLFPKEAGKPTRATRAHRQPRQKTARQSVERPPVSDRTTHTRKATTYAAQRAATADLPPLRIVG